MQRHSQWRTRCPPAVEDRLRQVAEGRQRLLLLREPGPTAFLVAAPGVHRKPHQVFLNDPHTCSCAVFRRERDLCVHICWALVRKLGLSHTDQRCFQLGLSANDLESLLQRAEISRPQPSGDYEEAQSSPRRTPRGTEVSRRPATPTTTCPICMETLLDVRKPVTHCRRGCGHLVHISCMRVLAAHQLGVTSLPSGRDANVACPLCRGVFCTLRELQLEARNAPRPLPHFSAAVAAEAASRGRAGGPSRAERGESPRRSPSPPPPAQRGRVRLPPLLRPGGENACCSGCGRVGRQLLRCVRCSHQQLCAACLTGTDPFTTAHVRHGLAARRVQPGGATRWEPLKKEELFRWLSSQQDDTQLDAEATERLPAELLQEVPVLRVREGHRLLARGQQCCLCLTPYLVRQCVRALPCGHQFHSQCLARWLLDTSATCPIDGTPVRHDLLRKALQRRYSVRLDSANDGRWGPGQQQQQQGGSPRSPQRPAPEDAAGPGPPLEVMVRRLAERRPPSCRRRLSSGSSASTGAATPAADAQPTRQLFSSASSRAYSMPARPLTRGRRAAARTAPQQRGFSREQTPASNASTGQGPAPRLPTALEGNWICDSSRRRSVTTANSSGSQSPGRLSVQCLELSATQRQVRAGGACLLEPRVVLSAARASRARGTRQAARAQAGGRRDGDSSSDSSSSGSEADCSLCLRSQCSCSGSEGDGEAAPVSPATAVDAQLALQCTRLQLAPRSRPPSQHRATPRRP